MIIVYLHEIDIDELGHEIALPCAVDAYLIKYSLISDCVCLQASSSLKRADMFLFFQKHTDFFLQYNYGNINKLPLISFILESTLESYSQYIEERFQDLAKEFYENSELLTYRENQAIQKAKNIDSKLSKIDIIRTDLNIDALYRAKVISFYESKSNTDPQKKALFIVKEHAAKAELFQTFSILSNLYSRNFNRNLLENIGHELRKRYFEANAESAGTLVHSLDWHFDYFVMNDFFIMIKINYFLNTYRNAINRYTIEYIKQMKCYCYLLTIYYGIESIESFTKLYNYVTGKDRGRCYEKESWYHMSGRIFTNIRILCDELSNFFKVRGGLK